MIDDSSLAPHFSAWRLVGLGLTALGGFAGCASSDEAATTPIEVTLVDRDTAEPVAGAELTGAKGTAVSDEQGLARLLVDGTLQITADGYVPLSVNGIGTEELRLPLSPRPSRARTVRGSIVGWEALPPLEDGHYRLAQIRGAELKDAARIHEQAVLGASEASCIAHGAPEACDFELELHPDVGLVFAVVVEGDESGTPDDPSDDTLSGVGFALTEVEPGDELLRDQGLRLLPAAELGRVLVKPGRAGDGIASQPVGVPGLSVDEQVLVFPSFAGMLDAYPVPLLAALPESDDSTLWGVALAADEDASSFSVARGLSLDFASDDEQQVEVTGLRDAPALERSKGGDAVTVPLDSLLYVRQDAAEMLSFAGTQPLPSSDAARWLQLCPASGGDAALSLREASRCAALLLSP
jgi:hypothetical protein